MPELDRNLVNILLKQVRLNEIWQSIIPNYLKNDTKVTIMTSMTMTKKLF